MIHTSILYTGPSWSFPTKVPKMLSNQKESEIASCCQGPASQRLQMLEYHNSSNLTSPQIHIWNPYIARHHIPCNTVPRSTDFDFIHYSLKLSAFWWFAQPLVQAQINENNKAPRHWCLWEEFTGDRASNAENVSILMASSWFAMETNQFKYIYIPSA